MTKTYAEMNEWDKKDDRIRWAQALNLAVELLIAKGGAAELRPEFSNDLREWRTWFYERLNEPTPIEAKATKPGMPADHWTRKPKYEGKFASKQGYENRAEIDAVHGVGDEKQSLGVERDTEPSETNYYREEEARKADIDANIHSSDDLPPARDY